MSRPLLNVTGLRAGYGATAVLDDLALHVAHDEIVALIGPNGAGKSSAMKAVFGMLDIHAGRIEFDGDDITGWSPDRIVRRGICFVPQVDNVFREMSVHDNLEMGAFLRRDDLTAAFERVYTLFPDLHAKRRAPAGALSGGQRQMVAMGRALMLEPRLLLLDEPTAGLSPRYMEQIFNIVRSVRDAGVAVLLVEQHAKQALALCDRGYVLTTGSNRHEGRGRELLANPEVAHLFLGG